MLARTGTARQCLLPQAIALVLLKTPSLIKFGPPSRRGNSHSQHKIKAVNQVSSISLLSTLSTLKGASSSLVRILGASILLEGLWDCLSFAFLFIDLLVGGFWYLDSPRNQNFTHVAVVTKCEPPSSRLRWWKAANRGRQHEGRDDISFEFGTTSS